MTIVLASTSRIRRQLLEHAGVAVEIAAPPFDEDSKKAAIVHLPAKKMALELAAAKALSIAPAQPSDIVIGADQVLAFAEGRLDKPPDLGAARNQLLQLRGKTHRLISAVACARGSAIAWSHVATAELDVRDFSDAYLDAYLARMGQEATQSVGAYKLEGLGAQLFDAVRGDYFTILGLPLLPLLGFLRDSGELPA